MREQLPWLFPIIQLLEDGKQTVHESFDQMKQKLLELVLGASAEKIVLNNILSGGAAERCGLSDVDIVEQIDDTTVTSEEDWTEALDNAEEVVTLKVRKAGSNDMLNIDVPAKAFVINK